MKHNHAPSFKQKGNFEITNVSLLEIYDRNYFTSPCLPVTYLCSPVAPSHLNISEAMANVCKDLSSMANSQLEHFCCLKIYIVISVEVSFGETFRKADVFVLCTISGENPQVPESKSFDVLIQFKMALAVRKRSNWRTLINLVLHFDKDIFNFLWSGCAPSEQFCNKSCPTTLKF